jgi:hypothetical protein
MKKSLRLVQITNLNLVPVATVAVTFNALRDFGIEFEYGTDDFDKYAIAVFELKGAGVFALSRYDHAPGESFDLLVEENSASEPALSSMIRAVAQEFGLPEASFSWLVNGQPAQLAANQSSSLHQHA